MKALIDLLKNTSFEELAKIAVMPDWFGQRAALKEAVYGSLQDHINSKEYVDACSSPSEAADVIFKILEKNTDDVDVDLLKKLELLSSIVAPVYLDDPTEEESKQWTKETNECQVLTEFINCVQQVCLNKLVNESGGYVNAIFAFVQNAKDKLEIICKPGTDLIAQECQDRLLALETKLLALDENPNDEMLESIYNDIMSLAQKEYSNYIDANIYLVSCLSRAKDVIQKEIFLTHFFPEGMSPKQKSEVDALFAKNGNRYSKFLIKFLCKYIPLETIPDYLDKTWCMPSSSLSKEVVAEADLETAISTDQLFEDVLSGNFSCKEDSDVPPSVLDTIASVKLNQPSEKAMFKQNLFQYQITNAYEVYQAQMSLRVDNLFNAKVAEIHHQKLQQFPSQPEYRKKYLEKHDLEFLDKDSKTVAPQLSEKQYYSSPYKAIAKGILNQQSIAKVEATIQDEYKADRKSLRAEAKQEARVALTEAINAAAKATMLAFINFIRNYIETADWKTGIFGGESVTINGKDKVLPKNVYAIYKQCVSLSENPKIEDVQKVFNQIMVIGKKADQKNWSFFGLNKRDKDTAMFYMFFGEADKSKAKYVKAHPEHISKHRVK